MTKFLYAGPLSHFPHKSYGLSSAWLCIVWFLGMHMLHYSRTGCTLSFHFSEWKSYSFVWFKKEFIHSHILDLALKIKPSKHQNEPSNCSMWNKHGNVTIKPHIQIELCFSSAKPFQEELPNVRQGLHSNSTERCLDIAVPTPNCTGKEPGTVDFQSKGPKLLETEWRFSNRKEPKALCVYAPRHLIPAAIAIAVHAQSRLEGLFLLVISVKLLYT